MAKNLYEFYKEKGEALPTVQQRAPLATQAGITNYAGTAEQNARLLAYLQTPPPTPAPTPAPAPVTPPPVPTVPTGPAATPAGLGLVVPDDPNAAAIDRAAQDALRGYNEGAPDEATIRARTIASFQAEIDALDRAAAEARGRVTAKYQDIGNRRVGSQRALLADSGMLGQVAGESEKTRLESANADELNAAVAASDEVYNAQKRALLTQARTIANDTYQAKLKAYSEGAAATVDYLRSKTETAKKNALTLVKQALATGIDLSDKKNSNDVKELAKQLGVSQATLLEIYQDEKDSRAAAAAKAEREGQFNLGQGERRYDANGNIIAEGAVKPEPVETRTVGNSLLERNPDGSWTMIYTAPEEAKNTFVKVNGKDYQVGPDGTLSEIAVPSGPSAEKIESTKALKQQAQDLLNHYGLNNAVGPKSSQIPGWMRSGQHNDFLAAYNNFIAKLTTENLGLLKGPMSDKDIEFLKQSVAGLNPNMTEDAFKAEINKMIQTFDDVINNPRDGGAQSSIPQGPPPPGEMWVRDKASGQYGSVPTNEYDPNLYEQVTFNKVGNTTASKTGMRTDRHNNPAAFTTDVAKNAGLVLGVDYTVGDPFPNNPNLKTARLIGDPVAQTIKVIDRIGFYTQSGKPRWSYVASLPNVNNWPNLTYNQKKQVVAKMYSHEGGSALKQYFA